MGNFATRLDEKTIQFVRILPGPIEKVWEYLYDGKKRGEWFASGDMPSKSGETFNMFFKNGDLSPNKAEVPEKYKKMDSDGMKTSNRLLVLEPPHRLVFEFDAADPNSSIVEFALAREGDGKVRFTLTHSKVQNATHAVNFSGGWHSHLEMLEHKIEGKTPPAFWDMWRTYSGEYEKRYAGA